MRRVRTKKNVTGHRHLQHSQKRIEAQSAVEKTRHRKIKDRNETHIQTSLGTERRHRRLPIRHDKSLKPNFVLEDPV